MRKGRTYPELAGIIANPSGREYQASTHFWDHEGQAKLKRNAGANKKGPKSKSNFGGSENESGTWSAAGEEDGERES